VLFHLEESLGEKNGFNLNKAVTNVIKTKATAKY
jgi:hypothetical protein